MFMPPRAESSRMESESSVPGNVGRVDEALRVLAVLGIIGAILAVKGLDVNWAPILVLGAFPLVAYLLLTSFVHVDPVYMFLRVDTRHHAKRT